MSDPLLRVVGLTKSFGSLAALHDVSLQVEPGEVLGVAGQSGSGKTVLIEVLAGRRVPDGGDLYYAGRRRRWPVKAHDWRIGVILSRPELVEDLDICHNVFLGNELAWPFVLRGGFISARRHMESRTTELLARLGLPVASVRDRITGMPGEHRQMIAIARAMVCRKRLMLVDDPSTLLGARYRERFLSLIQQWREEGIAVIFASDNLDHLTAVTDRIAVLREGRLVTDFPTDRATREEIVAAMVGTVADRQAVTPLLWALDSLNLARRRAEELRVNQSFLERVVAASKAENLQLIGILNDQVHALNEANRALQDAQRRLLTEREEERKHLAREIHDQVIQDLLSIGFQIEEIESDLVADEATRNQLAAVRDDIGDLIRNLRYLCGMLRPPTIDNLGLGAAIKSYAHEWSRRTGILVRLEPEMPELGRLPEPIALSVFRIVQEALNNVRKHADASEVSISLSATSPRMLLLTIADNGRGLPNDFDMAALAASGHYGLLNISERVVLMEGRLRLQNGPGGGLHINIEIPHPRVP